MTTVVYYSQTIETPDNNAKRHNAVEWQKLE